MTEKVGRDIDHLFSEGILPLARLLRARGVTLLDTALSKETSSYFVARPRTRMERADFETGGCRSAQRVEEDLRRLWSAEKDEPLRGLVPDLAKLARALRSVEEEAGDVSSFIYVMY